MHPAFSVIFFTVTSGLGYGLIILLILAQLTGFAGEIEKQQILTAGITAIVLITLGLLSSTLHLANRKNAWRAFNRFRTSWLSKEGVFSVLFYPFALGYLAAVWWGDSQAWWVTGLGSIALILAALTIFSTGMIYACLKTIRQWHTALTPTSYIWLGLMLGALALTAILGSESRLLVGLTLAIIVIAAIVKWIYFMWIGTPKGSSINTATGFTRAVVRILDPGHTAGTFLTHEFGYEPSAGNALLLRSFMFLLAFIVPGILLIVILNNPQMINLSYVALVIAYVGVLVERWLFFAEARHVVNLYHGRQQT